MASGIDQDTASDSVSLGAAVTDSLPFFMESMTEEAKKEMGHQLIETVPI